MLKRLLITIICSLYSCFAFSKQIRVLVVDTGVDISHLNIRQHVNIANWEKDDYVDLHGHGTHIAGIILDGVCNQVELVSCKFYSITESSESKNMQKTIACFKRALGEHITIINYSAGGQESSDDEYKILKQISDAGISIIVAAGNNGKDLSDPVFSYYPAEYPLQNITVVGNLEQNKKRNISSNYGLDGMVWEIGTKIWSTLPANSFGYMTGTSQATARRTNRILRKMCLNE